MDPFTLALVSAGVNIGGSLLGELLASGDDEAIRRLEEEAAAIYGDVSAPTLERVLAEKLKGSAMEGLPQDFGNKQARNLALQQLVDMGLQGGMDDQSRLALEQGRRAAALQETQGRGAVRQEFARRGLGGAGEAMLQQQAQQAGADRASLAGMQAAGDARSRALQALATGGGMAGQAEAQDFAREAARAQSMDAIARFNAEQAQEAARFNAGQQQQEWLNQMGLRDRQYEAKMGQIASRQGKADKKRRVAGGIGQGLGYGINAYGQGQPGQAGSLRGPPQANRGTPEDPWW